jgi:CheY-like chemotaxis protein
MTAPDDRRVLVVDDDVDICHNLSDILGDLGYRVDCAHDGASALALVRDHAYDVALLDFKMPGMDGLTLYREIKKLRPETVALLVTAYAGPTTADEALAAGTWRVVPKPVNFSKLLGLVDEALEQPLILVVDDDEDLCASLWDILRERGFRVSLAHDAGQAARRLAHSAFQVVLIDMKIPGGHGGDVFRAVRDANPSARTLLITGFRQETDALIAQALSEGANAVCYKPFDVPQLLSTLEGLAGGANGSHGGWPG